MGQVTTIKETNKTYISVPVHRWLDETTNKSGNMHRGLHTRTKSASLRISVSKESESNDNCNTKLSHAVSRIYTVTCAMRVIKVTHADRCYMMWPLQPCQVYTKICNATSPKAHKFKFRLCFNE